MKLKKEKKYIYIKLQISKTNIEATPRSLIHPKRKSSASH